MAVSSKDRLMQPNDEAPNVGDVATATAGEEAKPIHALRTFRIDARLNVLVPLSSLDAETWDIGWAVAQCGRGRGRGHVFPPGIARAVSSIYGWAWGRCT